MENKETITGHFERVIFRNDSNFYTVAIFYTDLMSLDDVVVVGYLNDLDYDQEYVLYGSFIDHQTYGIQFSFVNYKKVQPNDKESIVKFLSSPVFPSIGKKTAEFLYDSLGDRLLEIIKENPKIIDTLDISDKQKDALYKGVMENGNDFEHLVNYFSSLGIGITNIVKIEKHYGESAIELITENPYRLMEDLSGIGFKTCEKIANNMGFNQEDDRRYEALLIDSVLNHISNTGDSYIDYDILKKIFIEKNSVDNFDDLLLNILTRRTLIREENRIYHYTQYDSEKTISQILNMFPLDSLKKIQEQEVIELLREIEDEINIDYDESQISAILKFLDSDFSILTGGPGTGKTTIINAMVLVYKKMFPNCRIALTAPTGRAAKRLSELTDCDAYTIHSLLKWELESNTFSQNKDEPLEYDILIIDEFSMVDQWLFSKLLEASLNVKKILIVGDEHQLPSVLPGSLLSDLISSEMFPVERLNKIYRQKDGSSVIYLADKINKDKYDELVFEDEVRFIEAHDNQVDDAILQIISQYLKRGYTIDDIQVLAPMYRNNSGINILNNKIQELVNPASKTKEEFKYGYHMFRENDKVLQLKNMIDLEVYNGDIGEIVEIDKKDSNDVRIIVDFEGNFVEYSKESLSYLTFAYCISIHKSQGSEYPIVIIPIVKSSIYMLKKRLLYTAITRSKKNLLLVGDKSLFIERIQCDDDHQRQTTLVNNLKSFAL